VIPKILHYCWFGTKPIPADYQGYIDGWKRLMPDYEIRLWNEENSPMHLPYLQAALSYKKWANLSNFVRIYALYHHGGIYLDTDMELLKSLEAFRKDGSFLGLEMGDKPGEELVINNAIFGAEKGHPFIVKCMDFYLKYFDGRDSALDSSPYLVTRLLKEEGMQQYGQQKVAGVALYPKEYFYPYHITEKFSPDCVKENTHAIHHWGYSWGKRPFSYRLEHYKTVFRNKLYQNLSIHQKGYLKDGKLVRDLLKGGQVKAGPFEGVKVALSKDYEQDNQLLKLAGLYKEELQFLLYQLVNNNYKNIYYKGESPTFFKKGLAQLFPEATIHVFSKKEDNNLNLNRIAAGDLLISNSTLAQRIVHDSSLLPSKADVLLEFNYHLPDAEKEQLQRETAGEYELKTIASSVNYQYEQNAFLQNYAIKEIEQHLKRAVTDVQEWIFFRTTNTKMDER
jgi:mannosyltransferase OCH1-like enzyme